MKLFHQVAHLTFSFRVCSFKSDELDDVVADEACEQIKDDRLHENENIWALVFLLAPRYKCTFSGNAKIHTSYLCSCSYVALIFSHYRLDNIPFNLTHHLFCSHWSWKDRAQWTWHCNACITSMNKVGKLALGHWYLFSFIWFQFNALNAFASVGTMNCLVYEWCYTNNPY